VVAAVIFAGTYATLTLPDEVPWQVFLLAPIFGLINGTAEEVYWRGAYLKLAKKNAPVWLVGLICFTVWHLAFIIPGEMVFVGGPIALIAGAFGAGVFWMWVVWQTNRIGWTIVSHILFNTFVFIELFAQNFV
jgi:membrane protease YdiL (CAAX protease family)